jgi:NTP pyrophosphatase (non-canonical NTP hydrolase)
MHVKSEILKGMIPLVNELDYARHKFPDNQYLMTALAEEVGELAEAYLIEPNSAAMRKEALQVACVAMRIATEGCKTDGESLEVVRAMMALEPLSRVFWDGLKDRPDLAARSHPDYVVPTQE